MKFAQIARWILTPLVLACCTAALCAQTPARRELVQKKIAERYGHLDALYKHFHAHPELSGEEKETGARLAEELKAVGCEVTTGVGGQGVVGLMRNGEGPVIMIRADMDALPIVEQTGLDYASKVRAKDRRGVEVGVMHACGHDINITCLAGTAYVFSQIRDQWKGTLMFVGQPAEETGQGARAMLADGLFHRFPRPQFCFATHCDARFPHGHVSYRAGQMQANVDSVDIIMRGVGGHGSAPQNTIDPIVLSARVVLDLQTIRSRETHPRDPVVVTVGAISGGTKHNIIGDDCSLQLTVRTTNMKTRKEVLSAIDRIAKGVAVSARAPEPKVRIDYDKYTPALVNDVELANAAVADFEKLLGKDKVHERPLSLGGEDFARYIIAGVPGFYWFVGTADPEAYKAAKAGGPALASTHSDRYYPVPKPTIETGLLTMATNVLRLNGK